MRRWLHLLLAFVIAAAVLVPPRVHAMAGPPGMHHAAGMGDCNGHDMPQPDQHDRQHTLCMAACACLPVAPVVLVGRVLPGDGERLMPAPHTLPLFPPPDLLLRPPKALS